MWNPRQPQRLWEVQGVAALDTSRVPGSVPGFPIGRESLSSVSINRSEIHGPPRAIRSWADTIFVSSTAAANTYISRFHSRDATLLRRRRWTIAPKVGLWRCTPPLFVLVDNEEPEIRVVYDLLKSLDQLKELLYLNFRTIKNFNICIHPSFSPVNWMRLNSDTCRLPI